MSTFPRMPDNPFDIPASAQLNIWHDWSSDYQKKNMQVSLPSHRAGVAKHTLSQDNAAARWKEPGCISDSGAGVCSSMCRGSVMVIFSSLSTRRLSEHTVAWHSSLFWWELSKLGTVNATLARTKTPASIQIFLLDTNAAWIEIGKQEHLKECRK